MSDQTNVPGILLLPKIDKPPYPAILYCHAHGNRYDISTSELLDGRPALTAPYADDLLKLGFAVLCLEMPCFGSRNNLKEDAQAKAAQWHGRTLFGQMLGELACGLEYLASHENIDASRITTMGISMGGTHAWWLAALDQRIKACVHMCCFADMESLIETGAHDGHGHYMTVPNLLNHASTAEIAGLVAPRAQLCCVGLNDWSTPPQAFEIAQNTLEKIYADQNVIDRLQFHIEPELGHEETIEMRHSVLDFLKQNL